MQFMQFFVIFAISVFYGDLSDPVAPTLRVTSEDVVTAYAYQDRKGRFLPSLALPRADQGPCERPKVTVSTNNGLRVCMGRCRTYLCSFHPGQLKN